MSDFAFDPVDTLFFRDSRPFNSGEGGNLEATSNFPPSPASTAGALKAAIARHQGWVRGNWHEPLVQALNHTATFRGPYLERRGVLYFPAPAALLFEKPSSGGEMTRLVRTKPGRQPFETDAGSLRLCMAIEKPASDHVFKEPDRHWISKTGFESFLRGETPNQDTVLKSDAFWSNEQRVGIQRTALTHTTGENALYQVAHTRLEQGVRLLTQVHGLLPGWVPRSPAPVGGEGRMVSIHPVAFELPQIPDLEPDGDGHLRYTATLLTPLSMHTPDLKWNCAKGALPGLPGEIVSAAVSKAAWIGGWDTEAKTPKPLEPMLPAGSVFFLETSHDQRETLQRLHLGCIAGAAAAQLGYGQIAIGMWEDQ